VFLIPSLGRTFAQIGIEEKNRLSHRRKALEALAQKSFSVVGVESVTDGE
jgi:inosine/xanthosine triphosphate pyrophosphatase family protein